MSWFKSVMLGGVMLLVAWGVWRTLTLDPTEPQQVADAAPPWNPVSTASAAGAARGVGATHSGSHGHGTPSDGGAPGFSAAVGDPGPSVPPVGNSLTEGPPPFDPSTAGGISSGPPATHSTNPDSSQGGDRPVATTAATLAARNEAQRLGQEFDAVMKQVEGQVLKKNFAAALEALSPWYPRRNQLNGGREPQLLSYLDKLAGEVIYSPNHHLGPPYVVAPGDTLAGISKPFAVPGALLAKINSLSGPSDLTSGKMLKVVPGPFHAEVNVTTFELTLILGGKRLYAGRFKVGVGQQVPLTEGEYTVKAKRPSPPYYPDPENNPTSIPGGDPQNPLGHKLIEFEASGDRFGALHGTNEPSSIGRACPEGCIRLAPRAIDDVYDILVPGVSKVFVVK